MKLLIATMLLLFSTAAFAGDKYLVTVEGMSCPFCAHGVEKKVRKMTGVAFAAVDLKTSTVAIEMEDGAKPQEEAVKKAIMDAGFSFKSMEKVEHDPAHHTHTQDTDDGHH